MKVTVEKTSNNDNTFRTPLKDLDGMPQEPVVGKGLFLSSSTHESGGIFTSDVMEVEMKGNVYHIKTKNSTYIVTPTKEE